MDESVTHHVRKGTGNREGKGMEVNVVLHSSSLTDRALTRLPRRPATLAGPMQEKP